jgi:hypothetical protein
MDLPEIGLVGAGWDLRDGIDTYLGELDYRGKRVVDVGTASGFLTFSLEARGAEVVSFDLDGPERWDLVPFADPRHDLEAARRRFEQNVPRVRRAYWLAHRLLGSRAKAVYGNIFDPPDLGQFDVAVLGMILPHIRDPFGALASVARFADTLVVTQQAPHMPGAWAYFMPDPDALEPKASWWSLSEDCMTRMLAVLGFGIEKLLRREYACSSRGDREECTTFVARRQVGAA